MSDRNQEIDLGAMLEKRKEVVGSSDQFPFKLFGETFWITDPKLATDEWVEELDDIDDGDVVGIAIHYIGGEDNYDRFKAVGKEHGHDVGAMQILEVLRTYSERQEERDGDDPTRRPSSNRFQRRSRRR